MSKRGKNKRTHSSLLKEHLHRDILNYSKSSIWYLHASSHSLTPSQINLISTNNISHYSTAPSVYPRNPFPNSETPNPPFPQLNLCFPPNAPIRSYTAPIIGQ